MPPRSLPPWQVILFTVAVTAGTLGVRLALEPRLDGQGALIVFTVPMVISAYVGGLWAGLLSTFLSCLATAYLLPMPDQIFDASGRIWRWQMIAVAASGVLISVTYEALRRARRDASNAHREQQVTEQALRESRSSYRALAEWSPEPIIVHRAGSVVFVNPAGVLLMGARSTDELIGKPIATFMHPEFRDAMLDRLRGAERGHPSARVEMKMLTLDGRSVDIEAESTALIYDGEPALLSSVHDVSERKKHEVEIERLNRLYAALSHVNQAIVRRPTREALFVEVCRVLVEYGGVRLAWIGIYDEAQQMLVPAASWGDEQGVVQGVPVAADDAPESRRPSATAFAEARAVINNDLQNDPAMLPWHDVVQRGGFQSCAVFPIRASGFVSGVLSVCAVEAGFFQAAEIALLGEAAEDLSFALDNIALSVERERAERRAREYSREATDLLHAINQHSLVALTDANGIITFANDKLSSRSQYSTSELIGQDHRLINSRYHSAAFMRDLWATIKRGEVWQGEIRNTAKDGTHYWVDTTIVPFLNGDGSVRQYMEIGAEITERKEAEFALRIERDRAQQYLDTAEVILLALDITGSITLVNRYACAMLGWSAEELIGRDFIETCVPPKIRDATRRRLAEVHAGSDSSVVLNPIITRSGEERLIEWRNTLLRDSDGVVASTFSSGSDLTERNEAIEALRAAEERMRFALESANVGIWDMDITTGLLRWSDVMEAQYGLQAGGFPGTLEAFGERVHPQDWGQFVTTMDRMMRTGGDFTQQHRALWPDGTIRVLSGAGRVVLGEDGTPVRAVGISLDITEQRVLEAQFQQAQKMEAVGRLAGGVAHDFNNLLTVMLGFCELLLNDMPPTDHRRADLEEIQKAGVSAAALTRQLLAFSRKQITSPTLLNLSEVVSDIHGMIERLIGEDINVLLRLQADLGPVMADRAQLEQVIMNLTVNARDAMSAGGGALTIETRDVDLDEHYAKTHFGATPGSYVLLSVSDTGSGMTAETQSRLFEPFFTTKDVGKGTGLGMATVHGIVTSCGGYINVYSELGVGTSFKIYLPRAHDTGELRGVSPPMVEHPTGTLSVLVVEDADALRELTRRLLERQGYSVLVAANAGDALSVFDANQDIDLLLTDVVMPGASGPELAAQLVERRPSLAVIYMSGYTDEAIVQHGVLNPGITMLNKPFTSAALARKIREVFEQRSLL